MKYFSRATTKRYVPALRKRAIAHRTMNLRSAACPPASPARDTIFNKVKSYSHYPPASRWQWCEQTGRKKRGIKRHRTRIGKTKMRQSYNIFVSVHASTMISEIKATDDFAGAFHFPSGIVDQRVEVFGRKGLIDATDEQSIHCVTAELGQRKPPIQRRLRQGDGALFERGSGQGSAAGVHEEDRRRLREICQDRTVLPHLLIYIHDAVQSLRGRDPHDRFASCVVSTRVQWENLILSKKYVATATRASSSDTRICILKVRLDGGSSSHQLAGSASLARRTDDNYMFTPAPASMGCYLNKVDAELYDPKILKLGETKYNLIGEKLKAIIRQHQNCIRGLRVPEKSGYPTCLPDPSGLGRARAFPEFFRKTRVFRANPSSYLSLSKT
uniref:Uncharacterized protein n=1 Tax=Trichogramma kaykai TaxID=54128 RepID=A0ABD2X342_9HYME